MKNSNGAKIAGSIDFIQNHVPPFDAGAYRIGLVQDLSAAGKALPLKNAYQFTVAGERFRLNPNEVRTVFPPVESEGEYDNVLPHIVLTRRTLPWERTATGGPPKRDDNGDVSPWLGLLVCGAADAPALQTVKVGDLFDPQDCETSHLPPAVFSPFSRRPPNLAQPRSPASELEYHEKIDDTCQVIDIPLQTFNQIAPAQTDLQWLAHARLLTVPEPKAPGETESKTTATDYVVLFGNRLPAVRERNTAYLVSLQAAANYLPDETGAEAADTAAQRKRPDQPKNAVRLVVLFSWSFTVKAAREKNHQSFAQLIANLNGGDPQKSLLRWTIETADADVKQAFALGYTALPHKTRLGDETISWYRGPFIPYSSANKITLPVTSADAITFYDEPIGMFDVSYAAAWQLGRLLALNNKGFATQLYNWKRGVRQRTKDLMVLKHLRAMAPDHENPEQETRKKAFVQSIITSSVSNALIHKQFEGVPPAQRGERFESKMQMVTDAAALEDLHKDKPPIPDGLMDWLDRLLLLHGVPFNYLVPDHRLLPAESLRFFHLDSSWMASLIDGANSIGRSGEIDAHDKIFAGHLFSEAVRISAMQSLENVSGFLLRSLLVDGWWPGLKIDGYRAEYDLQLMQLDKVEDLPGEGKSLLFVAKINDSYYVRIFDNTGKIARAEDEGEPLSGEEFVQQLDEAFKSQPIDAKSKSILVRQITSSLNYMQISDDHPDDDLRLPILRLERLSPNVLLCLFDGIVSRLDFHPPPEGLHFGLTILDRDNNGVPIPARIEKEVRSPDTGNEIMVVNEEDPVGNHVAKAVKEIPFRGERVIQVVALAGELCKTLGNPKPFTSAEFAMQMIEGTQMGGFIHRSREDKR